MLLQSIPVICNLEHYTLYYVLLFTCYSEFWSALNQNVLGQYSVQLMTLGNFTF